MLEWTKTLMCPSSSIRRSIHTRDGNHFLKGFIHKREWRVLK
jgi:hypothetical protein